MSIIGRLSAGGKFKPKNKRKRALFEYRQGASKTYAKVKSEECGLNRSQGAAGRGKTLDRTSPEFAAIAAQALRDRS